MEYDSLTEAPRTQSASDAVGLKPATMTDHSPGGDRLRELDRLMNTSPTVHRLQAVSDNIQRKGLEEEEQVQLHSSGPATANNTGMPDNLKSGIESLSGLSMDHVRVHRNSSRPAQLNAHAFAQGADIHLAPGQEQHLPHEAWHVVQQAQGRVKPTTQMKGGVRVNDDVGLEREADVMGARAVQRSASPPDPTKGNTERVHLTEFQVNSALVQRVVNAIPAGEFRGNLVWAQWFQAMTEEEVRTEATRLGLTKAVLKSMNDILGRRSEALIAIPDDYADPSASGPGKISADEVRVGMGEASASSESPSRVGSGAATSSESPFRAGSVPAPVDIGGKVTRGMKTQRRLTHSPINFTVMVKQLDDTYSPQDRPKNISQIPKEIFDFCYANAGDAFLAAGGEKLAITISSGHHIVFTTANTELLGEELAAIYAIRYEEPEPRSGAARAAADELEGTIRDKRNQEAPYASPSTILDAPDDYADYDSEVTSSKFSSTIGGGVISNRIVHYGPWAKGQRVPSQMGVMGGQNAKNYFLDHFMYEGRPPQTGDEGTLRELTREEKQSDLDDMGGRFEWLHIIGSSLGGPNVIGNLVCGTYDANTEMIALEHRVARWGQKGYEGTFQPTPGNPILIEGFAVLTGSGFVATTITLRVSYAGKPILERTYQALRPEVITKTQYALAEAGVEKDIDAARGGEEREGDDGGEGDSGT